VSAPGNTVDLVFLPWVRRGGATALQQPDTNGSGQPGVASATVILEVNSTERVRLDVSLMGPSHVTAVHTTQVIRTDPTAGSVAFEPNYFPLVEFDEPSLPWLFTPARATTQGRLRPWLCLAVVRKQAAVRLDPPEHGAVPVLRITAPAVPATELPDLADGWAWAHGQATAESDTGDTSLRDMLGSRPERSLSRLLCGRLLEPDTQYLACVVPTFELGRKAGLGLDITAADEAALEPAWSTAAEVELPVFYHWEFMTGPGGDFQSLALLLRSRPLPTAVGRRLIDVSRSGVAVAVPPETRLSMGGALRAVHAAATTWPDESVHSAFRSELARLLNLTVDAEPLLAPPRYGSVQGSRGDLDPADQLRWYEQVNLEPAARVAAQFGTRVVQEQQEALVASAWEQAADLRAVNRALRHAQLGCLVATSLHGRHLATMTVDLGLQVLAPAQARMTRAPAAHTPGTGLVALLADAHLTPGAFGTPLRRIARPQGAVNRRLRRSAPVVAPGSSPPPRTTIVLHSLQPTIMLSRRSVATSGPATLERVAAALTPPRGDIRWGEATAAAVQAALPQPNFQFGPIVHPQPGPLDHPPLPELPVHGPPVDGPPVDDPPVHHPPVDPPFPLKQDSSEAKAFRAAARRNLERFNPAPPVIVHPPAHVGDLTEVFRAALALAEPRQNYARAITLLVDLKGATRGESEALDQVGLAPRFPQPMAVSLAELGQELMLPGLDAVPANTIVPLETNTPFVEAYLVGLNAELGRELLWRDFPAPAQTTYFDRFWDTAVTPGAPPDIPPIDQWGDRTLGAGTGGPERFVMLVRSDLLRRYPNAIVYATKPATASEPAQESHPLFSGAMEPDVRFFGFDLSAEQIADWSIVIQEQPSAPRFGVKVDADAGGGSHLAVTDQHAGRLAARLRQTPVRITIPSAVLLREA
jgi:hypothetical protein